jgi:hypothetical protein
VERNKGKDMCVCVCGEVKMQGRSRVGKMQGREKASRSGFVWARQGRAKRGVGQGECKVKRGKAGQGECKAKKKEVRENVGQREGRQGKENVTQRKGG